MPVIKNIICIHQDKIKAARVVLSKQPIIENIVEYDLAERNITEIFQLIQKQLESKKFRFLWADEISYVVNFKISKDAQAEREAIAAEIEELIPESLADDEWDYRTIGENPAEKQIQVFAPVKDIFLKVSQATQELGFLVDAIEPMEIAKERNAHPMIGLAQKEEVKGQDSEVLNLKPKKVTISSEEENKPAKIRPEIKKESSQPTSLGDDEELEASPIGPPISKNLLILLIVMILLCGSLLVTILLIRKNKVGSNFAAVIAEPTPNNAELIPLTQDSSSAASQAIDLIESQPANEVAIATASVQAKESKKIEDVTVQILNGSGTAGVATEIKKILQAEGFVNIETGNADKFTYEDLKLELKENLSPEVKETIERALNGDYTLNVFYSLTIDSEFDVLITVGKTGG